MTNRDPFQEIIARTQVVRRPRHRLATFGASRIQYNLVTAVSRLPPGSTLRTGHVTAERPRILTPETFAKRFEGFGSEEDAYEQWLKDRFEDAFRGLEYGFRHEPGTTATHNIDGRELAANISRDLDERGVDRAAVIYGPESGWQFSLMKFILEETSHSFPGNVRELEEHGLFDPAQAVMNRRRREIEALFRAAAGDRAKLRALSEKLKEHGMFDEYQDRFFALCKSS